MTNEGTPLVNTVSVTAPTDLEGGFVMAAMIGSLAVNVRVVSKVSVRQHQQISSLLRGGDESPSHPRSYFCIPNNIIRYDQPAGGVKAGDVFQGQVVPDHDNTSTGAGSNEAHYGSWRDGIFDCCRHGFFHPHLWMGICFPFCLLGQVATRTGFWSEPLRQLSSSSSSLPIRAITISPFRLFFAVTVVYMLANSIAHSIKKTYGRDDDDDVVEYDPDEAVPIPFVPATLLFLCQSLQFGLTIFCFVAVVLIRRHVRKMYKIPAGHDVWEDICCACFCQSCSICQMARHTADYHTVDAELCSETGLAEYTTISTVMQV
jgi:Cys-rich protein (TIGR01571 family)